jgi:hypothetical protein
MVHWASWSRACCAATSFVHYNSLSYIHQFSFRVWSRTIGVAFMGWKLVTVNTVCAFLLPPLLLQYVHAITIWTSLNERPQFVNSYLTVPSFVLALAHSATIFIMKPCFPPQEIVRQLHHRSSLPVTFSCLNPRTESRMAARLEGSIEPSGVVNHLASREWRLKIIRSAFFLKNHQIMTLTVSSNAIVPDDDGSRCPLDSGLNILRKRDVIIEKL